MNNKFIVSADWHLRGDKPRCRTDEDWMDTQSKAIKFVYDKAVELKADLIHVGDLFQRTRVSPAVMNMFLNVALSYGGMKTYITPGNHDLYYNSWKLKNRSSFGTCYALAENKYFDNFGGLSELGKVKYPDTDVLFGQDAGLLFLHTYVWYKENFGFAHGQTVEKLLKKYPEYKWIFLGDNHHGFVYAKKDRHVINPGCLIRQAADLKDYEPFVVYVDLEKEFTEKIFVPDDVGFVTDVYLREEEKRNDRIEAFVESLSKSKDVSFSFIDNLKNEMKRQDIGDVSEIINELIEEI